ncbi:MAG: hypothetical protein IJG32_03070 [Selenomonadaceae bacterium]|nr:hypothetical protein [Selenomonadaceae bacterium]
MNELERFMRDVEADEDLAKRFGTVANRIALANKNLSEAEVKARAANELGYKVTATQLEIAAAEAELLDDDELEQVAGGGITKPPKTKSENLFKCNAAYELGEAPHCWGTNYGCKLIYSK